MSCCPGKCVLLQSQIQGIAVLRNALKLMLTC